LLLTLDDGTSSAEKLAQSALIRARLPDRKTVLIQHFPHPIRTAATNFTIVIMLLLLLVGLL
jgi:hypothetical protein